MAKTKVPLEAWEQTEIFKWRDENKHKYPELSLLHSSGNGLRLTIGQAVKAKAQGLTKGIPDIMLPVPNVYNCPEKGFIVYHGLFIELKRVSGSKISPEQKAFIFALEQQGYQAVVCYGAIEAINVIKEYLGIKD